jgi:hypothetical protein
MAAVKPAAPHKNGVVSRPGVISRPGAVHLGRLVEETRPVYIERETGKTGADGQPEYREVELTAWYYPTVRGEIKARLRSFSEQYDKAIHPDPDDIDPSTGMPRYVPNQEAWERRIKRSLRELVPGLTDDEAAFMANWGGASEQALHVLHYLGYWATDPWARDDDAKKDDEGGEEAEDPNPEAAAGTSS